MNQARVSHPPPPPLPLPSCPGLPYAKIVSAKRQEKPFASFLYNLRLWLRLSVMGTMESQHHSIAEVGGTPGCPSPPLPEQSAQPHIPGLRELSKEEPLAPLGAACSNSSPSGAKLLWNLDANVFIPIRKTETIDGHMGQNE